MGDLKLSDKERGVCLMAVVPCMRNFAGHEAHYHQAVSRAAELNGWKYVIAVPDDCVLPDNPGNWIKCLKRFDIFRPGLFRRICANLKQLIGYVSSVRRFLNKQILSAGNYRKIIFIESFKVTHFAGFVLSLFFISRRDVSVWVLYRQEPVFLRYGFTYKTLNRILLFLFNSRVRLLTDSELLQEPLESFFGRTVSLVPIPHANIETRGLHVDLPAVLNGRIICWWPGPPRKEKGWDIIKGLASALRKDKDADKLCLVAAESAQLDAGVEDVCLLELEESLSVLEYAAWMSTADIILLPYDSQYRKATSGIFIEGIVAGKIPIVTKDTWMANELSKYGLSDLVVDWLRPDLISRVIEIYGDKSIKERLDVMKKACLDYHNERSFAEAIKLLT